MPICIKCGKTHLPGERFCGYCGNQHTIQNQNYADSVNRQQHDDTHSIYQNTPIFCANCGFENVDGTKFCIKCGSIININQPQNQTLKSDIPKEEYSSVNVSVSTNESPNKKMTTKTKIIILGSIVITVIVGVLIFFGIFKNNQNENYLNCAKTLITDEIEADGGSILSVGFTDEKVWEVDDYGRVMMTITAHPLSSDAINYIVILQDVYDNGQFHYYVSSALKEYPDGSTKRDLKRYMDQSKVDNDWDLPN